MSATVNTTSLEDQRSGYNGPIGYDEAPVFRMQDGLVVIPAEAGEFATEGAHGNDDWKLTTEFEGTKGDGALIWTGQDYHHISHAGRIETGPLAYHFTVEGSAEEAAGRYYLSLRTARPETGEADHQNNDFFVRFGEDGEWVKLFFNGPREEYSYGKTFDHEETGHGSAYIDIPGPGEYTIYISGRSTMAGFDEIHLQKGEVSEGAEADAAPASPVIGAETETQPDAPQQHPQDQEQDQPPADDGQSADQDPLPPITEKPAEAPTETPEETTGSPAPAAPQPATPALPEAPQAPASGGPLSGDDVLIGTPDQDRLHGRSGDDIIIGLGEDDSLHGGPNDDHLYGGPGDDLLDGDHGRDSVNGDSGADYLRGGGDNDRLFGGEGDDTLIGQAGDDALFGESGNDRLLGKTGDDMVRGGAGDDVAIGGQGDDAIYGNIGDDILRGGSGDDMLKGGAGADRVFAGNGDDILSGDGGNDLLAGGAGADVFVFGLESGRDIIRDFQSGLDDIDLSGRGVEFDDLTIIDHGPNAWISHEGLTIVLRMTDADSLSAEDFLF